MFAVIKTGGKQYKVHKDDVLIVERLAAGAGETVQFNHILMLGGESVTVGDPIVAGAAVQAEVLEQGRGPKTLSFKKRRRKHSSKRLKGHRQYLTTVKVTDILSAGGDATGVQAALGAGEAASSGIAVAGLSQAPASDVTVAEAITPEVEEAAAPPFVADDAAEVEASVSEDVAVSEEIAASEAEVEAMRPANLLDAAQGEPDDLKQISGVGPTLEEKLHQNGVYHFWQIAEWGPSEIAFMDDQLSFKGRIDRDDWIGQATKFAAESET